MSVISINISSFNFLTYVPQKEPAQTSGSSFHPFRRSEENKVVVDDRLRTPASAGSAEEDEVTSSEEARDTETSFRTCGNMLILKL